MKRDRVELIERVQSVIAEYTERLTVRQVHYRLVAQQWEQYPNTVSSYRWLRVELGKARIDGVVAWDSIEDRTRTVDENHGSEEDAETFIGQIKDMIQNSEDYYGLPIWWGQPKRVQVWVEKQALASVFERVATELGVDFVVCRGYPSLSLLYEVSEVLAGASEEVEELIVLYFGDFDPSGVDIERSALEHLTTTFGIDVVFERVALTKEQITEYKLPPAPAKKTDSRRTQFVADYGVDWQVELDAILPDELRRLIRTRVMSHMDKDKKNERDDELEERRERIKERVREVLDDLADE